jgi:ABC-type multidrug transport system ATPase subunit
MARRALVLAGIVMLAPPICGNMITLSWKDLSYSIHTGAGTQKHILKNIHGQAEPGRLIAIMGPTGSGKTSLLNLLAARTLSCSGAEMSGEILVNGLKRDEESFRQHSAYVQQDDVLYPLQTVEETLMMAAQLRVKNTTPAMSRKLVDSLIHQLGLTKAKDTNIGSARVRGVSGGERKRTNLGIELTADPEVLFLDEPTSGLDSFQAEAVVRVLSRLCQEGRTIFMSIHQPSSQVYALFDKLMLLSEGQCVYFGEASSAVSYFANLGHKCPSDFNPADFLLETISIDTRSGIQKKSYNSNSNSSNIILYYIHFNPADFLLETISIDTRSGIQMFSSGLVSNGLVSTTRNYFDRHSFRHSNVSPTSGP